MKGYGPSPKKRKTTNKGTSWQCDGWNKESTSIDQASTESSRDNSVMVDYLRWSIKFSKEREAAFGAFRAGALLDENSLLTLLERHLLEGGIEKWIS